MNLWFRRCALVGVVYLVLCELVLIQKVRAGNPDIPEPMVFDLVRGLGAERGEIELNALGRIRMLNQAQGFLWAPELEYVFADGYAMEIEIPFEGTTLHSLKFALQGTIGMAANDRFIHGWQTIVEYELQATLVKGTLLYLAGVRLHRVLSLFAMIGVEGGYEVEKNIGHFRGIINPSVFLNVTPHFVIGVETNLSYDIKEGFEMLLMPQFHFKFGRSWQIQFGAGGNVEHGKFNPILAFRFVITERSPSEDNHKKPNTPLAKKSLPSSHAQSR